MRRLLTPFRGIIIIVNAAVCAYQGIMAALSGFNVVVGILEKWRILAEISWKNGINIIFLSWKSGNNQLNFIGKEEV